MKHDATRTKIKSLSIVESMEPNSPINFNNKLLNQYEQKRRFFEPPRLKRAVFIFDFKWRTKKWKNKIAYEKQKQKKAPTKQFINENSVFRLSVECYEMKALDG